eukprot:1153799-Pelagomonas_calceolata.AAC.8
MIAYLPLRSPSKVNRLSIQPQANRHIQKGPPFHSALIAATKAMAGNGACARKTLTHTHAHTCNCAVWQAQVVEGVLEARAVFGAHCID